MRSGGVAYAADVPILQDDGSFVVGEPTVDEEKAHEARLKESERIRGLIIEYTNKETVLFLEETVLQEEGSRCLAGGSISREIISSQNGVKILRGSNESSKSDFDIVVFEEEQVIRLKHHLEKVNGRYAVAKGEVGDTPIEVIDARRIHSDAWNLLIEMTHIVPRGDYTDDLKVIQERMSIQFGEELYPEFSQGYSVSGLGPFQTSGVQINNENGKFIYEVFDPESHTNALIPYSNQRELFSQLGIDTTITYTGSDEGSIYYQLAKLCGEYGFYKDVSPAIFEPMELILRITMEHASGRYQYAADTLAWQINDKLEFEKVVASPTFDIYIKYLERLVKEGNSIESEPIKDFLDEHHIDSIETHVKNRIHKNFAEVCSINPELAIFYNLIYFNLSETISPIISEKIAGLFEDDKLPRNNSLHQYILEDGNADRLLEIFPHLEDEMQFISRLKKACSYLYPIGEFGRPDKTPKSVNEIFAILYYAAGYKGEGDISPDVIKVDLKNWDERGLTKSKLKKDDTRMDKVLKEEDVIEDIRALHTHFE